ncbi:hypothetical protein FDT66_04600 [Polaribacter aestuariivivens]|uniref:Sugar transporter n=1 Tax=Polaribacter aestuariivivens TaxID=2304626 RepID=A0A5S3N9R0_9FLAO|nr:hypothetical protein [Polaribacter aestuariivivens]TMM31254.1 hypothetical protein FDT66_04600 [Polaribacter aestuariivivens]
MTTNTNKPSTAFWVIGVIALLWNLMGVSAYLFQAFVTEEMIAELPPEQQAELLIEHPAWLTALFALAVFGGFLACIFLLARKKIAYYLFIVSGICAIIQQVYLMSTVELSSFIMPILIVVVCIFLIWYAKKCSADGILK